MKSTSAPFCVMFQCSEMPQNSFAQWESIFLAALDSETKHNFGNPCEKRDKKKHTAAV